MYWLCIEVDLFILCSDLLLGRKHTVCARSRRDRQRQNWNIFVTNPIKSTLFLCSRTFVKTAAASSQTALSEKQSGRPFRLPKNACKVKQKCVQLVRCHKPNDGSEGWCFLAAWLYPGINRLEENKQFAEATNWVNKCCISVPWQMLYLVKQ